MQITKELKTSLSISNNINIISDQVYKKLLEHSFSELIRESDSLNLVSLYNSKPDVVKELHSAFLTVIAECARHNLSKENVVHFLSSECGFNPSRSALFGDLYDRYKLKVQIILGNIGTHLPHIVDIKWNIDYIVKMSSVDKAEGPIFRINLLAETYNTDECCNKIENINFSCNAQELQDLVYKLKEASRHCQRIAAER